MSEPDFRKHFTASDHDGFQAIADEIKGLGATWCRLTNLAEVGMDAYCIEGWRKRPEDDGPRPTADSPEYGFDVPVGFV